MKYRQFLQCLELTNKYANRKVVVEFVNKDIIPNDLYGNSNIQFEVVGITPRDDTIVIRAI